MRLAAFTKYGRMAASTRQRLLQYVPHLAAAGIEVEHHPLLPDDYVRSLVTGDAYPRNRIAGRYLDRFRQLVSGTGADVVWIYAELFPYLPTSLEKLAFRSGRPVVYDWDDAHFHTYNAHRSPWVRGLLGGKFEPLLSRAAAACCGNAYLQDYASRFCSKTVILPTVLDTDAYSTAQVPPRVGPVTIGWVGSPTNWPYVRPILPLLQELVRSRDVRVRVIGAGSAARRDTFPGLEHVDWSEASEAEEIRSLDIGIMPAPDDGWVRGKCGYKLVQYMACGLPVVASPVGTNEELVTPGHNGFLADSNDAWRAALLRLIDDAALRRAFGAAGLQRVKEGYSLQVQAPRLVQLLQSLA